MRLLIAVVVAATVAGCARDVRARYPSSPGEPTGSLVLTLTNPSPNVIVAVNGVLVVDGANTSRIRIDGVATGYADVAIAIGPAEKQVRVWIDADRDTVLPVGSPGGSPLDSVKSMAMSLAAIALYAWIR